MKDFHDSVQKKKSDIQNYHEKLSQLRGMLEENFVKEKLKVTMIMKEFETKLKSLLESGISEWEIEPLPYQSPLQTTKIQIEVAFVSSCLLRSIDHGRASKLRTVKFEVDSKFGIRDLKETLINFSNSGEGKNWLESQLNLSINYYASGIPEITRESCRLWKLDNLVTLDDTLAYFKQICNQTKSYDYRIPFKGILLEEDKHMIFESIKNGYCVLEIREQTRNSWHFQERILLC